MIRTEPLAVRVRQIESLSQTLKRVTLEAADGGLLPTPQPGAHISLVLPGDPHPRHNAYSIVSACNERAVYQLIVRRTANSRGGSRFIHEALRIGQILQSSPPNSQFQIQSLARKFVLIGGGVGITPLLSFLPELRARRAHLEMHQIVQAHEVTVFERLLQSFGGRDIHVHAGRVGFDLVKLLERQPLGSHLYCCGPQPLMDAVRESALALGWPSTRVHQESFGAIGGDPFTVKLARSGREILVGAHETMLEALEDAGVPAPSLCRGGACGECLTTVLGGAPDHRDHVLSEAEKADGRLVLPCVSRSKTPRLILDL